jgi:hypothetical protein
MEIPAASNLEIRAARVRTVRPNLSRHRSKVAVPGRDLKQTHVRFTSESGYRS